MDHRACLVTEAILQASVAELVDRSDSTQDIAFASILEEPQEAKWGMPAPGKLRKRERSRPGPGVGEPAHEANHQHSQEPSPEPHLRARPRARPEPGYEAAHEPGQEPKGLITPPGGAGTDGTRVTRSGLGESGH
jgi:hypothetical protein